MKRTGKITGNRKIARLTAMILSLVLALGCLTACGDGSESQGSLSESVTGSSASTPGSVSNSSQTDTSLSQDAAEIVSSNAAVNDAFNAVFFGKDSDPIWAGVQFYNGETVKIWRKMNGSKDKENSQDIYLFDSKNMGKVIVDGVPETAGGTWFYTNEGYCLNSNGTNLSRVEADGTEKYNIYAEGGVKTIIQLADGTIVLLMKDTEGVQFLAVLDGETGEYRKVENLSLGKDNRLYLGTDDEKVLVMNRDGFWDVNLETGEMTERSPMSEFEYTIEYAIKTFRLAGGSAELLFQSTSKTIMSTDIEKYRTMVELLYPSNLVDAWLQLQIDNFNRDNPMYYVEVIPFSWLKIETEEDLMELLASGQGPDLIYGSCFDNVQTAIDAGYLEDLVPYMEQSGIGEEDYFPTTFERYKQDGSIYGAPLTTGTTGLCINEDVLGGTEIPDVEGLVDALLAYTEPSVIEMSSRSILKYLLGASESLCGTVDWENGSCNFHGNLFSKIMEVAKLYGIEADNVLPVIASSLSTSSFYGFSNQEQRELAEEVYIGCFFDDGTYPAALNLDVIHINSNSRQKEGAWALLADLLGEESQMQLDLVQYSEYETYPYHHRYCPVNVYAYDMVVLTEIEETALVIDEFDKGRRYTCKVGTFEEAQKLGYDNFRARYALTEQDTEEMLEMMYNARNYPLKTEPILNMIYEEAESYFSGERSLGDTCEAIQQRAQAYLDELKSQQ